MRKLNNTDGFTVPELVAGIIILSLLVLGVMQTYFVYIDSTVLTRKKSIAISIGTEQLEKIKALPYDQLAVTGGSIITSGPTLPPSIDVTNGNFKFEIRTNIQYVDDAFDGCFNYPVSQKYLCKNGPVKTGVPIDPNPRDYKVIDVTVLEKNTGKQVAFFSTQSAARVAETGSNTGALVITVITSSGQPVIGATVKITNSTITPNVNQTNVTDSNGVVLFLDTPPDSQKDYVITASKSGYSSLSTIPASGSLNPVYPNIAVFAQTASQATMQIDEIATDSLHLTAVRSEDGSPLANTTFNFRGGIKLYSNPTDLTYSYQQNITTNSSGEIALQNLVPGTYFACRSTTDDCGGGRKLSASQSAYISSSSNEIFVPPGNGTIAGIAPPQFAKIFLTTNSNHTRIRSINPNNVTASDPSINDISITINGANLSGATVTFVQGAITLPTIVGGTDQADKIIRKVNLSGKNGAWQVVVVRSGTTAVQNGITPGVLGGFNVTP